MFRSFIKIGDGEVLIFLFEIVMSVSLLTVSKIVISLSSLAKDSPLKEFQKMSLILRCMF